MPASGKSPTVDEVTDDVNLFGVNLLEKCQEFFRLGIPATEMDVTDEEGPEATSRRSSQMMSRHGEYPFSRPEVTKQAGVEY